MGNKRRLIKSRSNSKFNRKYSQHPRFKFLHSNEKNENITIEEVAVERIIQTEKMEEPIEEIKVEIKKTNNIIEPSATIVEAKPEPIVKTEVKKQKVTKPKRKRTSNHKTKKTKQVKD